MDKLADYPNFSVMLYAQVITSDDDPIKHATTEPTLETCSMTTPFYGEEHIADQLWMLNQYSYTEQEGVNAGLFYATGFWNDQLAEDKIALDGGMLWGWDATASNQQVTATESEQVVQTADDPTEPDQEQVLQASSTQY